MKVQKEASEIERKLRQQLAVARLDAASDFEIAITGTDPPTEFRLFKAGLNRTSKGDFIFDAQAAQTVIASWKDQGNKLFMDWEHAVLSDPPTEAPAAAWYKLEVRNGELWATDVQWTPRAAEQLRNREYAYYSPAFNFERKTGRIVSLINVALTNYPATKEMRPLVAVSAKTHDKETDMALKCSACKSEMDGDEAAYCKDCMTKARKALVGPIVESLGLAADAGDGEIVATLGRSRGERDEVLKLTGAKSHAEALGVIAGWKAGADQVEGLTKKIAELEGSQRLSAFDKLVEEGKLAGKLTPAMCHPTEQSGEFIRSLRSSADGEKTLRAFLSAAPVVVPVTETKAPEGEAALKRLVDANPAELGEAKKVAALMGVKYEDVIAHRASIIASGRATTSGEVAQKDAEASAK